jgi:ferredoxin
LVSYSAGNRLLIIGPEPYARSMAESLRVSLDCTVLATWSAESASRVSEPRPSFPIVHAQLRELSGYLGQFTAKVVLAGTTESVNLARVVTQRHDHFDLVLDLSRVPELKQEVLPPGYYAPRKDSDALNRALTELPEMVGEFEKPKYFNYDPDICAHGRAGLSGCTRCLDVCPTAAISSLADRIEADPYRCQGAGSCATACPTGAISYVFPSAADVIAGVRTVLKGYREAGGEQPALLFHDREDGRAWLGRFIEQIPESVIPCAVEEIGSVGLDAWLAAIAYGADVVYLLCAPALAGSVRAELVKQLSYANAILAALGYAPERVRMVAACDDPVELKRDRASAAEPALPPAGFAALSEKRSTIGLALDHLYAHSPTKPSATELPSGAPFGQILVDRDACTLCMACVSVCPAAALEAGGEQPRLSFIEWNCVQCGLCESACPEDAVARHARIVLEPTRRREMRTLNEEEPFTCIVCGKPFANRRLLERMRTKLQGHWLYQQPAALRRLEMCEDCRVKDMWQREGGLTDVHSRDGGPRDD